MLLKMKKRNLYHGLNNQIVQTTNVLQIQTSYRHILFCVKVGQSDEEDGQGRCSRRTPHFKALPFI